jgi:hypothetical protein
VGGAPAQVAGLSSPALKSELIDAAVRRFLTAIYLQPEFHRAVYNLGTAVYGYAQEARKLKLSRAHEPPPEVLQRCARVTMAHVLPASAGSIQWPFGTLHTLRMSARHEDSTEDSLLMERRLLGWHVVHMGSRVVRGGPKFTANGHSEVQ